MAILLKLIFGLQWDYLSMSKIFLKEHVSVYFSIIDTVYEQHKFIG